MRNAALTPRQGFTDCLAPPQAHFWRPREVNPVPSDWRDDGQHHESRRAHYVQLLMCWTDATVTKKKKKYCTVEESNPNLSLNGLKISTNETLCDLFLFFSTVKHKSNFSLLPWWWRWEEWWGRTNECNALCHHNHKSLWSSSRRPAWTKKLPSISIRITTE